MHVCTYDYVPRWVMTGSCWGLVAFYHPFRFEFNVTCATTTCRNPVNY